VNELQNRAAVLTSNYVIFHTLARCVILQLRSFDLSNPIVDDYPEWYIVPSLSVVL